MTSRSFAKSHSAMIVIIALSFVFRIAYLDTQSLWWDETFSIGLSSVEIPDLLDAALHYRVHPPLYYLLLHFWQSLGRSPFLVRAPSVFFGVLSVAIIFALGRLLGGNELGSLSAFLFSMAPFHIWYSQETRMYAFNVLLALSANLFFLRLCKGASSKNWVAYISLSSLAAHADYMYLLIMVAQMSFLTIRRRDLGSLPLKWLGSLVLVGLIFSPWMVALAVRGGFYRASISWIAPARPADLFWTLYTFVLGSTSDPSRATNLLAAVTFLTLLLCGAFTIHREVARKGSPEAVFLLYWLFIPWLLVFFISLDWPLPQKRSMYLDRFLSPLLPAALLMVSYAILHAQKRSRLAVLVLGLVLIPSTLSLRNLYFDQTYYRDDWQGATAYIKENWNPGDLLLIKPHELAPLYYYATKEMDWLVIPELASAEERGAFLSTEMERLARKPQRAWLIVPINNANPHGFIQERNREAPLIVERHEAKRWMNSHYPLLEERFFNGIHLSLYALEGPGCGGVKGSVTPGKGPLDVIDF